MFVLTNNNNVGASFMREPVSFLALYYCDADIDYKARENLFFYTKVCGGGPYLSCWHLPSSTMTATLQTPSACPLSAVFHEDKVLFEYFFFFISAFWRIIFFGFASKWACLYCILCNQHFLHMLHNFNLWLW